LVCERRFEPALKQVGRSQFVSGARDFGQWVWARLAAAAAAANQRAQTN